MRTHMHCMKRHLSKIGVWCKVSWKWTVELLFSEDTVYCSDGREIQQDGEIAHAANTTAISWNFFSDHIFGCGFGQTDLTSWCGDFLSKESTATIQGAWRTPNMTTSRLLMALTTHCLKICKKQCGKGECWSSRWRWTFSTSAIITYLNLCTTFLISWKK